LAEQLVYHSVSLTPTCSKPHSPYSSQSSKMPQICMTCALPLNYKSRGYFQKKEASCTDKLH